MAGLQLVLFDDAVARTWMPFTLTRPAGELRFGALTLRARAEHFAGVPCAGHLTDPQLDGFAEPGTAPVIRLRILDDARPRLFLSTRAVPDAGARFREPATSGAVRVGAAVTGWYAAASAAAPDASFFDDPASANGEAVVEAPGSVLGALWHIVTRNGARLCDDLASGSLGLPAAADPPAGTGVIGHSAGTLRMAQDATIEPGVVLDFTEGPICLDRGAQVRAFTRLAGPAYVGAGSVVLGGSCADISVGPVCKVHGELEACVILGYTNKAHDGFLGHAMLGCWVNLGALTTNSDLKNNYGTIRMWTPAGEVDTGEQKLGCFLGDHVKTGIGLMLNTGTVVGAGSNLFGAIQPPKYVPPFRWGSGERLVPYELDRFLDTARAVLKRRGVALDDRMRAMLERAWQRAQTG